MLVDNRDDEIEERVEAALAIARDCGISDQEAGEAVMLMTTLGPLVRRDVQGGMLAEAMSVVFNAIGLRMAVEEKGLPERTERYARASRILLAQALTELDRALEGKDA